MPFIIADTGDAQGGDLPEIVIVDFCNRDIEFISRPRGDSFNDPSFIFKGPVLRYTESDMTNTNVHYSFCPVPNIHAAGSTVKNDETDSYCDLSLISAFMI